MTVSHEAATTMAATTNTENVENENLFVRAYVKEEISKLVLRKKLAKQRHLVLDRAIEPSYLDSLFPEMLKLFDPQTVTYNGGIANIREWKISCYLEVMEGGIPCTHPNVALLKLFRPLLNTCNDLFLHWYRQQHACNRENAKNVQGCRRLMTFITRYTPNPGEQALLKVRRMRVYHTWIRVLYLKLTCLL